MVYPKLFNSIWLCILFLSQVSTVSVRRRRQIHDKYFWPNDQTKISRSKWTILHQVRFCAWHRCKTGYSLWTIEIGWVWVTLHTIIQTSLDLFNILRTTVAEFFEPSIVAILAAITEQLKHSHKSITVRSKSIVELVRLTGRVDSAFGGRVCR